MSEFTVIKPVRGFIPEGKALICRVHECEFVFAHERGGVVFCLQLVVLRPKKYERLMLQQLVSLVPGEEDVFVSSVLKVFRKLGVDVDRFDEKHLAFDEEHLADEFEQAARCIAKDRDVVEVIMGCHESFNITEKLR